MSTILRTNKDLSYLKEFVQSLGHQLHCGVEQTGIEVGIMVQQGCILGALLLRSLSTLVVRVQPDEVVLAAIGGGRAAEVAPAARVAHRVVSVRPGARRATRGRGREVGLFKGDASIHCGAEGTRCSAPCGVDSGVDSGADSEATIQSRCGDGACASEKRWARKNYWQRDETIKITHSFCTR